MYVYVHAHPFLWLCRCKSDFTGLAGAVPPSCMPSVRSLLHVAHLIHVAALTGASPPCPLNLPVARAAFRLENKRSPPRVPTRPRCFLHPRARMQKCKSTHGIRRHTSKSRLKRRADPPCVDFRQNKEPHFGITQKRRWSLLVKSGLPCLLHQLIIRCIFKTTRART